MNYNNTAQAMLQLIRCALHSIPPQPLGGIDYEQLYKLCAFHSVESIVAMALESGGLLTEEYADPACIKRWKDAKLTSAVKVVLLDTERKEIFHYFEEQGIWYLPLKGILLKDMYPKLGMRQMADNDILFDKAYRHKLKDYMESRGYQAWSFQQGNHDVYLKPPVYNFEFHADLFPEDLYFQWTGSNEDLKGKLKKDPENRFGYHFSDEDFYIHLLLHGHKHYKHDSGIGIRLLIDIFVFLSKKEETLDWEYVNRELAAVQVQAFESNVKALAQEIFQKDAENALIEGDFLESLLISGTYGTFSNRIHNSLQNIQEEKNLSKGKAKLYYFWKRVFPGKNCIMHRYPFCRRHPWSIPFGWFLRLISTVFLSGKNIWKEIKEFRKISKSS